MPCLPHGEDLIFCAKGCSGEHIFGGCIDEKRFMSPPKSSQFFFFEEDPTHILGSSSHFYRKAQKEKEITQRLRKVQQAP
jgi:4-aminobutyrate aminotransferase-like enzyme